MHHWYFTPKKYICFPDFRSAIKNISILHNQDCNYQDQGLIFVLKEFYLWRKTLKTDNKIRCKLSIEMSLPTRAGSRIIKWSRVINYDSVLQSTGISYRVAAQSVHKWCVRMGSRKFNTIPLVKLQETANKNFYWKDDGSLVKLCEQQPGKFPFSPLIKGSRWRKPILKDKSKIKRKTCFYKKKKVFPNFTLPVSYQQLSWYQLISVFIPRCLTIFIDFDLFIFYNFFNQHQITLPFKM